MTQIAVFARNHKEFLEKALQQSFNEPNRQITFRSAVRWVRAKTALDIQGIVHVYLAPIGSDSMVEYKANLKLVVLDPSPHDPRAIEALNHELEETASEGLWSDDTSPAKTLYCVSNFCRLQSPLKISQLLKASDEKPISNNYNYSYLPILEPDEIVFNEATPEEIIQPELYFEGALRKVSVNAYERNYAARKRCVAYYGTNCVACGFNFRNTYGEIGQDYIHVHHLIPLSSVSESYCIDPIQDLRPVCPNCHAMLHMRKPPFTVDELISIINAKELNRGESGA